MNQPTPKQREWLLHLRDVGPAARSGRGPIGYRCMQAGWTEWWLLDRVTGGRLTRSKAKEIAPELVDSPKFYDRFTSEDCLETITPAGRAVLEGEWE